MFFLLVIYFIASLKRYFFCLNKNLNMTRSIINSIASISRSIKATLKKKKISLWQFIILSELGYYKFTHSNNIYFEFANGKKCDRPQRQLMHKNLTETNLTSFSINKR